MKNFIVLFCGSAKKVVWQITVMGTQESSALIKACYNFEEANTDDKRDKVFTIEIYEIL